MESHFYKKNEDFAVRSETILDQSIEGNYTHSLTIGNDFFDSVDHGVQNQDSLLQQAFKEHDEEKKKPNIILSNFSKKSEPQVREFKSKPKQKVSPPSRNPYSIDENEQSFNADAFNKIPTNTSQQKSNIGFDVDRLVNQ